MNAQQAPSWCCRHNAPSGAAQTACVVAHRIIDGSSHSANPTRATVVRPDPVDEKRFALAHINRAAGERWRRILGFRRFANKD